MIRPLGLHLSDSLIKQYIPRIYGGLVEGVQDRGRLIELGFWDTANGEDEDRLRPLSYVNSGIIVICFAVDDPVSLQNVTARWHPEIAHWSPGVPILLLGCKADLRRVEGGEGDAALNGDKGKMVTMEQARTVADAIGAVQYLECSALLDEKVQGSVKDFLEMSAQIATSWKPKKRASNRNTCQII